MQNVDFFEKNQKKWMREDSDSFPSRVQITSPYGAIQQNQPQVSSSHRSLKKPEANVCFNC